jgi:4-amino-4-deoxy-L-arabinose transferase-like glycosyltransferase
MRSPASAERVVLLIIAAFTALRLVLATVLGLGVDEAYSASVARDLELSYFDHPPLQYWIAHLVMPLLGDGRGVRLPFIALFAASSWLLYRLTQVLFGARAGVIAVLALNVSGFFTVAVGGWMLPDGPLVFALLGAALTLARLLFENAGAGTRALSLWLQTGVWLGVALLAKYHAVLFALGLLLFLVSVRSRRHLLRDRGPWLAALMALVIATPVWVWNSRHHWASFAYQLGRGEGSGLHPQYVVANILGQAIWILPWIFVPLAFAGWRALRSGPTVERSWFCACLALPSVAIFSVVPLFGHLGLPHWQMPGWLMLYPLLGDYAARLVPPARLRRFAIASVGLVVVLGGALAMQAATGIGRTLTPWLFARGDPTLDALEWSQLPPELAARGLLRPGTFLITTSWIYAGKIDQAFHGRVPIVVFGNNPKQYALRYPGQGFVGRDALVAGPADSMRGVLQALQPYFDSVEEQPPVTLGRAGLKEIELRLLLAHRLRTELPVPDWAR